MQNSIYTSFRKFVLNDANHTATKLPTMTVMTVMVFLLCFFTSAMVHAEHVAKTNSNVEQQECYLCHQGIDTPTQSPQIQFVSIVKFGLLTENFTLVFVKNNDFVQPLLRAPPIFQ